MAMKDEENGHDSESRESQTSGTGTKAIMSWRAVATAGYILTGSFTAGYCMAALNSPGNLLMDFMNETSLSRGKGQMSRDTQTSLYGLLSAIFAIGACISAVSTQKMAEYTGRKTLLALAAIAGVISALLMGLSKLAGSHEMLFVGRAISGLAAGVQIAVAPFYLSEVLPKRHVGRALMINSLMNQVSGVIVGIVGFEDLFATPKLWPVIAGSHGVVAILQLMLLTVAVPSPYFMFNKGREQEAERCLQLLRGNESVEHELKEMKEDTKSSQKEQELTVVQLFRTPSLRRLLLVIIVAFVSMRFTGVIIVIFYSVQVLQAAGLSSRMARYVAISVTSAGIVVTLLAVMFIHRLSRRVMLLTGMAGLFLTGAVLSAALIFGEGLHWLQIIGVVCIPLMAGSHAFGTAQVPWLMIPELFEGPARGAVSSVCVMVLWLSLFVIGYAFPPLQEAIGPYSVLPFVGLSAFFFVFFFVLQPETLKTKESTKL